MNEKPRIILFDLETLPHLLEALKVWPAISNFPGKTLRASINSIICFGYKIHGEEKAKCVSAWDFPEWQSDVNNDKEVCKFAYEILSTADVIVTQNGKGFDMKFLQTRLLHHGFPPLPRIHHVDTKILAKNNLYIFGNSLKLLAKFLTDTEKMENEGWDLWEKTYHRDPEAMQVMSDYCTQDVEALDQVFTRLKPFMSAADMPNHNLFRNDGTEVCPNCGSFHFVNFGTRPKGQQIYQRLQCKDCGTTYRGPVVTKKTKIPILF